MNYPLISEYISSIKDAEYNFKELGTLRPVLGEDGEPVMTSGNFAVVFKMKDEQTGKLYAVKCFLKEQEGRAEAYRMIAEELEYVNSTFLTPIKYLDKELFVDTVQSDETVFPVLLMDWIEGVTLDRFIREHIDDQYELSLLAYQFSRLAMWLMPQPFAHGDLKPDNILVKSDGTLVLVDYDGMYVPAMKGQKARELGSPDFHHPSRTETDFDEHIDDFSLASILLSLKAISLQPMILEEYGASDRLLFSEKDYRNLSDSSALGALQPLMQDAELASLYSLYILALSQNNLSQVSFRLFNLKRPERSQYKKGFLGTERTDEDWKNVWTDEYGAVYSKDKKRLLTVPKKLIKYSIKKGTLVVCDNCFYECNKLLSITIPDGVLEIGDEAFGSCEGLESVIIPKSVRKIGGRAFAWCNNLSSITLLNDVLQIGKSAFKGCKDLKDVSIPKKISKIEDELFYGCKSIKKIVLPKGVVEIGNGAFLGCSELSSISIPNSVISIGNSAFQSCKKLDSVALPDSVLTLGASAFSGCTSLGSINVPNCLNCLEDSLFSGCASLQAIDIPPSVSKIGFSAFSGCIKLKSVLIPEGLTHIEKYAFLFCI